VRLGPVLGDSFKPWYQVRLLTLSVVPCSGPGAFYPRSVWLIAPQLRFTDPTSFSEAIRQLESADARHADRCSESAHTRILSHIALGSLYVNSTPQRRPFETHHHFTVRRTPRPARRQCQFKLPFSMATVEGIVWGAGDKNLGGG
jgi:hypothetical protein